MVHQTVKRWSLNNQLPATFPTKDCFALHCTRFATGSPAAAQDVNSKQPGRSAMTDLSFFIRSGRSYMPTRRIHSILRYKGPSTRPLIDALRKLSDKAHVCSALVFSACCSAPPCGRHHISLPPLPGTTLGRHKGKYLGQRFCHGHFWRGASSCLKGRSPDCSAYPPARTC